MLLSESSKRVLREEARRRDLIGRHATAEILGITLRTLQRWYRQGIGPQRKNGEHKRPIQYSKTEVEEWAAAEKQG